MVPVSVDANEYLAFRLEKSYIEGLNDITRKSLNRADRRGRSRGLGFSVTLPKRLDKIFGEGGAGLKVSGFRRITFSGRSQWTDAASSEIYSQSKFPSMNMEQVSRFDINGTIGTKISVKVSQDSQSDLPLENRIQIRFKGDDDDILKSVEAGNTTLSLPNTQFVGYSSQIRGLFGLKAEAQVGNLRVIGIASQEKGSTESASFTATGEENAVYDRDYEYVERRIFDLGLPGEIGQYDSVKTLFMYETVPYDDDLEATPGHLWVDPDCQDSTCYPAENVKSIRVNQMPTDGSYTFYNDPVRNLHYVVLNSSGSSSRHLGCWMVVKRQGDPVPDTIGNISGDTLDLKLLSLSNAKATPDMVTWDLMWRNCYQIARSVTVEDIDLKIFKGLSGTQGNSSNLDHQDADGTYLEILGLDRFNSSDQMIPDGLLDDRPEVFRPDWGLIIMPNRQPFNSTETFELADGGETKPLKELVDKIYDYRSYSDQTSNSKYYLQLSTRTRSSIIKLNRANIIEGSEKITLNGRLLTRGTDYNIEYDFGSITLLTPEASDPNADLKIDYEYAPFLAVDKKSLFGMRAEYEWSKDLKFGSTVLYKSDKAQDRKPKVGQETAKTVVFDTDMSAKFTPMFLTSMVDALPLIETEMPSNVSLTAEVARSYPNPNVEGAAYIDDFESALDQLSLGTSRTTWRRSSMPFQLNSELYQRSKLLWHNPRELINVEDVYDRETAAGEGTISTLRMVFRPNNIRVDSTEVGVGEYDVDTTVVRSWGGVTRYFNSRVDNKRAQLFEVRARGSHGLIHFDFGKINEDINHNSIPDSEDLPPNGDGNGAVDDFEDNGIDGRADSLEAGYDPVTNPDPAGDNWYFQGEGKCPVPGGCDGLNWDDDSLYYEFLNGTEGNIKDPTVVGVPDKEALSSGAGFETNDAYYSFMLDISSDEYLVENSELNGWRTYRIPIRDSLLAEQVVSSSSLTPSWDQISHVRVWFESADLSPIDPRPDTIEVAAWYFVQSNWQDSVIYSPLSDSSTTFYVASVSEDENTNFTAPPGVEAYTDPATDIVEAQRALLLNFESLNYRDTALATKDLISVDQYSGYRNLEMYVNGQIDEADAGKIKFFFRIGEDAENFYEYNALLYPGWDERNYVNIDFNEITGLKDYYQQNHGTAEAVDTADGNYRIFGRPNINQILYFAAGVLNTDTTETVDGEVWIDELRVTNVRKDVGTAGRVTVKGNMADLLNYNFSLTSRDPYFRGISSATRGGSANNLGSGRTETRYNYGVTLNIDKVLPRSWAARLPVTFSYSKATYTPLLRNNSDIVLPDEIREEEQEISESKSVSASASFRRAGKNPLFSLFLNRLKTSFSYRRTDQKSVTRPFSFGENYNAKADFDLGIPKPPSLPIFFWTKPIPILKKMSASRLSIYPERWKTSANYSRNLSVSDDVNLTRLSSIKRDFTGRMDLSYKMFENLSVGFTYDTRRDMSNLDQVNLSLSNIQLGLETHYGQRLNVTYDPKLFSFLTTQVNYRANYSDDWDRSSSSRRSSLSRSTGVSGRFDHIKFFGGKGSAGGRTSQRRRRGETTQRRNVRGGGQAKDADDGKPFYDPPLAVLRFLTGWITPISYSYSESFNNSLPGMAERPNWQYLVGFKDEPDVAVVPENTRSQLSTEGQSYEASTGFSVFGGIFTDVKFKQTISRDLIKQGQRYENTSTGWPELSIRIQKFKRFPLIKKYLNKFIDVFSPRTGYNRQQKETRDIDGGFLISRSTAINRSPLLALNFKLFRSMSLSGSIQLTNDHIEKFNPSSGAVLSETKSTKQAISFATRYSFSSPKGITLPLFGNVKFKSTVSIDLNVKMNENKSETSSSGGPFRTSVDKSDFSFSPVISYTFSQQIKGGLTLRWQDTTDNYKNKKNHTREVQIWTEIRF